MKKIVLKKLTQVEAMRSARKQMPPQGSTFRVARGKGSYNRKKGAKQWKGEF